MRAGVFLDALAESWDITLWIVPIAGSADPLASGGFIGERVQRCVVAPLEVDALASRLARQQPGTAAVGGAARPWLCRYATARAVAALRESVGDRPFDAVLVLRSYLAPFALPWLSRPAAAAGWLDLDDDEAATRRRLAALARRIGDAGAGAEEERQAELFDAFEARTLPAFATLFACDAAHADRLQERFPESTAIVVPNSVALPVEDRVRPAGNELRLLLVGNLSYLPNQEAAVRLAQAIVPRVRSRVDRPVLLRIVGAHPAARVQALAAERGVEVVANPASLEEHYAWADLAAAPLEAGGGTRIKLLEAFAHRLPVVATALAAEGLAVEDGSHLLLAESDDASAAALERLAGDSTLAARLTDAAFALVAARYSHAVVKEGIRRVLARRLPSDG